MDNLKVVAAEMLAAGIIPDHVANTQNPSFLAVVNGFLSGFLFLDSVEEIEDKCNRFLNALHKVGGPFVEAANKLRKALFFNEEMQCKI